jgi:hypothetical protein
VTLRLDPPRVLVCGSRRYPYPSAVETVLERLHATYGGDLVVIEGYATGADTYAHDWCRRHGLDPDRHRCYPVNWAAEKRDRPKRWRLAGPERNVRMLVKEDPRLVVGFHDHLDPYLEHGGTAHMLGLALVAEVPAWHVPEDDPDGGRWLRPEMLRPARWAELERWIAAERERVP